MDNTEIDFIIPWVDGADPKWIEERRLYREDKSDDSVRFRDWGLLKYWFRGVEKYASWVHAIYFVTWGHVPDWLNIDHPKLHIVKHSDYIPDRYRPTYSSHVIELNIHRIKNLSEHFVYFNDDLFLINKTEKTDFFVNGLPCDLAVLYPNHVNGTDCQFDHILLNTNEFFARHFDYRKLFKTDMDKWLTLKYGKNLLKTLLLLPFPEFPGLMMHHQPQSFLKSAFLEVWDAEPDLLNATCNHKFRTETDINQFIMRYWQIGTGRFAPYNIMKRGTYTTINTQTNYQKYFDSKYKILCLNDDDQKADFEHEKIRLLKLFSDKFPEKSLFEKD
jgi:hypothetical protein